MHSSICRTNQFDWFQVGTGCRVRRCAIHLVYGTFDIVKIELSVFVVDFLVPPTQYVHTWYSVQSVRPTHAAVNCLAFPTSRCATNWSKTVAIVAVVIHDFTTGDHVRH